MGQQTPPVDHSRLISIVFGINFEDQIPRKYFGDGRDAYLMVLADVSEIPYETLRERMRNRDEWVVRNRAAVKNLLFLHSVNVQITPFHCLQAFCATKRSKP